MGPVVIAYIDALEENQFKNPDAFFLTVLVIWRNLHLILEILNWFRR